MNKKVIIGICIVVLVVIIGVFAWIKLNNTFDKSNPIIFENDSNGDYAYIIYQGKEYVPYSAISPREREKYLGYVGEDKQDEIYTFKGHSEEEWLISCLNTGATIECMLYKEKSVTNIPDGLSSEYEWNNDNSTIEVPNSEFNRTPENVAIEVLEDTITRETVEILITDNNEVQYGWGVEFRVQEKVDGEWKNLKYISDDLSWIDIAYELNEDKQLNQKLDIEKYYGKLSNGIYRILKPVYDNGYIDIYSNEFEIK